MAVLSSSSFHETTKSIYSHYTGINVKGNEYNVVVVSGALNYISVRKVTNNPFGSPLGKEFKSFDEATRHYKSPEMKTELLSIELAIGTIVK